MTVTASPSSAFGTARDLRNRPQFRFGSEADSNAANWDVRLVPQADNVPGGLFFVIADTANLISNLDVQGSLLLVCTRARPPVSGLSYRSLGGILHNRFTERSTATQCLSAVCPYSNKVSGLADFASYILSGDQ